MKPKYWKKACLALAADDATMGLIIQQYRGETLVSRGQPFETLLRAIAGQQISVKAAQSVWTRVAGAVDVTSPGGVLRSKVTDLRSCGLSLRKVEYMQDLARHFDGELIRPESWASMEDEDIVEQLIQVRGIGRWSAEMFLIFHLLRPNVFPSDDLGLQKAIALRYKKRYPLSPRMLAEFRKKFSPWGTVATWYLWRSLDPMPVEY